LAVERRQGAGDVIEEARRYALVAHDRSRSGMISPGTAA
jgi:hypothetical protein